MNKYQVVIDVSHTWEENEIDVVDLIVTASNPEEAYEKVITGIAEGKHDEILDERDYYVWSISDNDVVRDLHYQQERDALSYKGVDNMKLFARVIEGELEDGQLLISEDFSQEGFNRLFDIGKSNWDKRCLSKYEIGVFDSNNQLFWTTRPDQGNFERNNYKSNFLDVVNEEYQRFTSPEVQHDEFEMNLIDVRQKLWLEAFKEQSNTTERNIEIFIGHDEVYMIEGLELDVEPDYFPSEYYTEKTYDELHKYIDQNNIKPISSESGYISIPNNEHVVVYQKNTGNIGYAPDFICDKYDKKTWEIMNSFYKDCVRFWEKEINDRGYSTEKNKEELALSDVTFISTNPYSPNGKPLDKNTHAKWIEEKRNLFKNNIKNHFTSRIELTRNINSEVMADFVMVDEISNETFRLGIWNGDYEDENDLYICPHNPESEYEDDNLTVVYMENILMPEKYKELKRLLFDEEYVFSNGPIIELAPNKDLLIDIDEYVKDERKGERGKPFKKDNRNELER